MMRWSSLSRLARCGLSVGSAGIVFILLLFVQSERAPLAQVQAARFGGTIPEYYPNCRFGVGGSIYSYNVESLNVGWYLDWGTQITPPHPNGAEYVQVIRLKPSLNGGYSFSPLTPTLYAILDHNPGALWLIGNEPDAPLQDNLRPEVYARAYHHLYYLLKQRDPQAQVALAPVVQATPLRFQYLDMMWDAYEQAYGAKPPADFWNLHSYILREIDQQDPEAYPNGPYSVWGAYIPPGLTATRGMLYRFVDMFDLSIFEQRLRDFRAWMSERGERDKPLYITEYGELLGYLPYNCDPWGCFNWTDENGVEITESRVAAFMLQTFEVLLNATDAATGYPADANRLVQRWLWYSVNDTGYGGVLFDPSSRQRRPLGDVFAAYTGMLAPQVDLAVRLMVDPPVMMATGLPQTTTLIAQISNVGNISVSQPVTVAFYASQPPTGSVLLGLQHVIPAGLRGCGATEQISLTWTGLMTGAHPVYVIVDPDQRLVEAGRGNNIATSVVLVATHRTFLPVLLKNYVGQ